MTHLSFDEFAGFLRRALRISTKTPVTESTLVEEQLGVTGDDGVDLLHAIEQRFQVSFSGSDGSLREAFGLEEDQYLFHGEGFGIPFLSLLGLRRPAADVKNTTVGDLYHATRRAYLRQKGMHE